MSAAIIRLVHPRALNHVRAAIDARAVAIGAAPADGARAKRTASRAVLRGTSLGWAYTQACRELRGAAPAAHAGGAA